MLGQKNYSAFECLCDVCSGAVINPICPRCLAGEIKAWLTLYPALGREVLPKLSKYLKTVEIRKNATICIKCKHKRAAVCPCCFTEYVLNELKKLNSSKIILREFLQFFNFDFNHNAYTMEAEKLGLL